MPDFSKPDLSQPDTQPHYDPNAIFREDGPIDPLFMADAIQALFRACPLNTKERPAAQKRHLQAALVGLAATNPRDPVEVMLAVQSLSAYQAACLCWRIGVNAVNPDRDRIRHISAAGTAARTFETMLRAIERRQAKPLSIPVGRPDPKIWRGNTMPDILQEMTARLKSLDEEPEEKPARQGPDPNVTWTQEDLEVADEIIEQDRIDQENEGLDIANTEGILPGGGMIMPEDPTPQQEAYLARRLALMYKREIEENLRNGITKYPKIRGIRPGDLIP
jgi:hypothetical protein